jgi:FixJ family two-component response regulator
MMVVLFLLLVSRWLSESTMKNARVIIVDDEPDVLEGLQAWLSEDYQTQSFESAELFLQAINDFEFEDGFPTCMLLDFEMPGMNGVELQSILKQINIAFPIIFMSGNAKQADIINAWHGGAVDFILKPFNTQQISDCLLKAFAQAAQSKQLIQTNLIEDGFNIAITQREAQVLLLLAKGYQQSDVADMLGVSLRTIKMYRSFLKSKLGLKTPIDMVRFCDKHQVAIEKIAGAAEFKIMNQRE